MEEVHDFKESLEKLEEAVEKAAEEALHATHVPNPHIRERVLNEFYHIVKDPHRLPFFFHPFIGNKKRPAEINEETQFSRTRYSYSELPPLDEKSQLPTSNVNETRLIPEYLARTFHLNDEHGNPRMIHLAVKSDNFIIGATGASILGTSMGFFSRNGPYSTMAKSFAKIFVGSKGIQNYDVYSLKPMFALRLVKHAVGGGILYDFVKRNTDQIRGKQDWLSNALAGAVCGTLYGLRAGGPQGALYGGLGFSICSAIWSEAPDIHTVTS